MLISASSVKSTVVYKAISHNAETDEQSVVVSYSQLIHQAFPGSYSQMLKMSGDLILVEVIGFLISTKLRHLKQLYIDWEEISTP